MTYLLLGEQNEPLLPAVAISLRKAGQRVCHLAAPLVAPQRFSWWLEGMTSRCELHLPDGTLLTEADIEGVLVRPGAWLAADGWAAGEREYAQAETEAALLAWLHSLKCTVVNRYSAAQWYGLQATLLDWQALLWQAHLPALDVLISNVTADTQAVMQGQAAMLTPLVSTKRYRIEGVAAWAGLGQMQQLMPLCLTAGYTQVLRSCVVGERVIWDGARPVEADTLEAGLHQLAEAAGLSFMTVEFAATEAGWRVAGVETQPQIALFNGAAQGAIVAALAGLLKSEQGTAKR
jgi:hypothetical protein